VLDGKATFEVDGEMVDAPAGTFVFVPPESRRKATGDGTVLAVGATPGEAYQVDGSSLSDGFQGSLQRCQRPIPQPKTAPGDPVSVLKPSYNICSHFMHG